MKTRTTTRQHRHNRIRQRISGTTQRPRLSIFLSLCHSYAQLIDDTQGKTIVAASDWEVEKKSKKPVDIARKIGELIAKKAKEKKITSAVYDRGGYKYHGRAKALAEGAREQGLRF